MNGQKLQWNEKTARETEKMGHFFFFIFYSLLLFFIYFACFFLVFIHSLLLDWRFSLDRTKCFLVIVKCATRNAYEMRTRKKHWRKTIELHCTNGGGGGGKQQSKREWRKRREGNEKLEYFTFAHTHMYGTPFGWLAGWLLMDDTNNEHAFRIKHSTPVCEWIQNTPFRQRYFPNVQRLFIWLEFFFKKPSKNHLIFGQYDGCEMCLQFMASKLAIWYDFLVYFFGYVLFTFSSFVLSLCNV